MSSLHPIRPLTLVPALEEPAPARPPTDPPAPLTIDDAVADTLDNLRAWRKAILRGVDIEDLEILVARLMKADEQLEGLEQLGGPR